jgi:hypothetical protein
MEFIGFGIGTPGGSTPFILTGFTTIRHGRGAVRPIMGVFGRQTAVACRAGHQGWAAGVAVRGAGYGARTVEAPRGGHDGRQPVGAVRAGHEAFE